MKHIKQCIRVNNSQIMRQSYEFKLRPAKSVINYWTISNVTNNTEKLIAIYIKVIVIKSRNFNY